MTSARERGHCYSMLAYYSQHCNALALFPDTYSKNPICFWASAWERGYVMLKCILVIQCPIQCLSLSFYKPHLTNTPNLCSLEVKYRVLWNQWHATEFVVHYLCSKWWNFCTQVSRLLKWTWRLGACFGIAVTHHTWRELQLTVQQLAQCTCVNVCDPETYWTMIACTPELWINITQEL